MKHETTHVAASMTACTRRQFCGCFLALGACTLAAPQFVSLARAQPVAGGYAFQLIFSDMVDTLQQSLQEQQRGLYLCCFRNYSFDGDFYLNQPGSLQQLVELRQLNCAIGTLVLSVDDVKIGKRVLPSPAKRAGLKRGDTIISVAGKPVVDEGQWAEANAVEKTGPVRVEYVRGGVIRVATVRRYLTDNGGFQFGITLMHVLDDDKAHAEERRVKGYYFTRDVTLSGALTNLNGDNGRSCIIGGSLRAKSINVAGANLRVNGKVELVSPTSGAARRFRSATV